LEVLCRQRSLYDTEKTNGVQKGFYWNRKAGKVVVRRFGVWQTGDQAKVPQQQVHKLANVAAKICCRHCWCMRLVGAFRRWDVGSPVKASVRYQTGMAQKRVERCPTIRSTWVEGSLAREASPGWLPAELGRILLLDGESLEAGSGRCEDARPCSLGRVA